MGNLWKRLKELEQKWTAQRPDTYDPAILELLDDDKLALVEQAGEIMDRLEQQEKDGMSEAGMSHLSADHPWRKQKRMRMLSCATDEELALLEQAAEILERAEQEHKAPAQPSNGNGNGNGHDPQHKQKTRGRPWKN